MAQRQPNRQPQRRPVPKDARQAPSGRAGTRPARPAPMHRNHAKRGRR